MHNLYSINFTWFSALGIGERRCTTCSIALRPETLVSPLIGFEPIRKGKVYHDYSRTTLKSLGHSSFTIASDSPAA